MDNLTSSYLFIKKKEYVYIFTVSQKFPKKEVRPLPVRSRFPPIHPYFNRHRSTTFCPVFSPIPFTATSSSSVALTIA